MIPKDELQIDLWHLADGGHSIRLTHLVSEISASRDYSNDEPIFKVKQELMQELLRKVAEAKSEDDHN